MRLIPIEQDRLMVFLAAELARRRLARGSRLSHPEAIAIVADAMHEAARDGAGYDGVVEAGAHVLSGDDVLDGVAPLVPFVRVECLFEDGMRLVVVPSPIRPGTSVGESLVPGERLLEDGHVAGEGPKERVSLTVRNLSDDVVWVGSHYPFFEVNSRLSYDRSAAWGKRLDIPAGDAVRFGPGETTSVTLVPFGGERVILGFNGYTDGPATFDRLPEALDRLVAAGVDVVGTEG